MADWRLLFAMLRCCFKPCEPKFLTNATLDQGMRIGIYNCKHCHKIMTGLEKHG